MSLHEHFIGDDTLTRAELLAARGMDAAGRRAARRAQPRTRPHRYAPRHTFDRSAPFAALVLAVDAELCRTPKNTRRRA